MIDAIVSELNQLLSSSTYLYNIHSMYNALAIFRLKLQVLNDEEKAYYRKYSQLIAVVGGILTTTNNEISLQGVN